MDKLVPSMYRDYGMYVNYSRSFPLSIDGLKPVERRILLSTYEIARDKFIKSARVDGHVIGHYHPHGSSYGTIVQLVNQGFLAGQGNFGNNAGVESSPAAAMRYTEVRLSKFINDLTFKLIDYVPVQDGELDDEPALLQVLVLVLRL
jgi:DNA gyrase subunit A